MKKYSFFTFFGFILGLGVFLGVYQINAAWSEPSCDPGTDPGACNAYQPINIGPTGQLKSGDLYLGSRLGIGTSSPAASLDIVGGDINIDGGKTIYARGDLNTSGTTSLFVRNANGLVVSNTGGGNGTLTVNGESTFNQRIGVGYSPGDLPTGWGGGVNAWDIVAKSSMRANQICLGGGAGTNNVGTCTTTGTLAKSFDFPEPPVIYDTGGGYRISYTRRTDIWVPQTGFYLYTGKTWSTTNDHGFNVWVDVGGNQDWVGVGDLVLSGGIGGGRSVASFTGIAYLPAGNNIVQFSAQRVQTGGWAPVDFEFRNTRLTLIRVDSW